MEKLKTVHKMMVDKIAATSVQIQKVSIKDKSSDCDSRGQVAEVQNQSEGRARSSDSWRHC